ncbi:MAG: leucine-rich repeat domain-containing protein [Oscillospiraceae bacterium]
MFCEKCGGELRQEENKLICTKCGAEYGLDYNADDDSKGVEYVVPRGFSLKKNIIIIIVAALLMAGIVGAVVAVNVTKSNSQTALADIQIAERYLSEQNYEQAVIEFEKILEIEPMNVEAYLGLAEAYIGLGDNEKALEMLRKGLELTGDARIQAKIDELTKVEEPADSSGTSSTPNEPPQIVYGDAECLAIEEMIEAYLRGEGEVDTSMLQNVTNLQILGTEVIVHCGLRIGTETHGYSWSSVRDKFTLRTMNGEVEIPYGSIDNINEDLPFIFDMPLLDDLTINFNQISDVSPFAGLKNLTGLHLTANHISDITPLAGLTNLAWLDLFDNQITDFTPLSGLTNLTSLSLGSNQISDITPLAGLTNLTDLNLGGNQLSDISALSGLTNLTYLYLWNNQISDISPLARFKNLTRLDLEANQISDISALAGLTNMTDLDLSWNQIKDYTPLAELVNLTRLDIYSDEISEADQAWLKEKLPNCNINF